MTRDLTQTRGKCTICNRKYNECDKYCGKVGQLLTIDHQLFNTIGHDNKENVYYSICLKTDDTYFYDCSTCHAIQCTSSFSQYCRKVESLLAIDLDIFQDIRLPEYHDPYDIYPGCGSDYYESKMGEPMRLCHNERRLSSWLQHFQSEITIIFGRWGQVMTKESSRHNTATWHYKFDPDYPVGRSSENIAAWIYAVARQPIEVHVGGECVSHPDCEKTWHRITVTTGALYISECIADPDYGPWCTHLYHSYRPMSRCDICRNWGCYTMQCAMTRDLLATDSELFSQRASHEIYDVFSHLDERLFTEDIGHAPQEIREMGGAAPVPLEICEMFGHLDDQLFGMGAREMNSMVVVGRRVLDIKRMINYWPNGKKRAKLQRRVLHKFLDELIELSRKIKHISENFTYIHNACSCPCGLCSVRCRFHEKYFQALYTECLCHYDIERLEREECRCECSCRPCAENRDLQQLPQHDISGWLDDSGHFDDDFSDDFSDISDNDLGNPEGPPPSFNDNPDDMTSQNSGSNHKDDDNDGDRVVNIAAFHVHQSSHEAAAAGAARQLEVNGARLSDNSRLVEQIQVNTPHGPVPVYLLVDTGAQVSCIRADHKWLAKSVFRNGAKIKVTTDIGSSWIPSEVATLDILSSNSQIQEMQFIVSGHTNQSQSEEYVEINVCDFLAEKYNLQSKMVMRSPILTLGSDQIDHFPFLVEMRQKTAVYWSKLNHGLFAANTASRGGIMPLPEIERFLFEHQYSNYRDTRDGDEVIMYRHFGLDLPSHVTGDEASEVALAALATATPATINVELPPAATHLCDGRCRNVQHVQTPGSYNKLDDGIFYLTKGYNGLNEGTYRPVGTVEHRLYVQCSRGRDEWAHFPHDLSRSLYYIDRSMRYKVLSLERIEGCNDGELVPVKILNVKMNEEADQWYISMNEIQISKVIELTMNTLLDDNAPLTYSNIIRLLSIKCPETFSVKHGKGLYLSERGWQTVKLDLSPDHDKIHVSGMTLTAQHNGNCCVHASLQDQEINIGHEIYDNPYVLSDDPTVMYHRSLGDKFLSVQECSFELQNNCARIKQILEPRCPICAKCSRCQDSRATESQEQVEFRKRIYDNVTYSCLLYTSPSPRDS